MNTAQLPGSGVATHPICLNPGEQTHESNKIKSATFHYSILPAEPDVSLRGQLLQPLSIFVGS